MRKNIILDLDNTLICSQLMSEHSYFKNFPYVKIDGYITYARPYLQEFLDYIFANFNVAVWTAASKGYARDVINKFILVKPDRKLKFVFYSYHCNLSKTHGRGLKDLSILWEYFGLEGFTESNTLIVDDNTEVKSIQMNGCYHIKAFDVDDRNSQRDTELLKLIALLKNSLKNYN